jgi:hypothetical protein
MSNGIIISPNMSLPIPSTGVTTGPEWFQAVVQCLNIIDQHHHSGAPTDGVQIGANSISLASNLPFNNFSATGVASVQFTPGPTTTLDTLYVNGVDLFYNDGNGNTIQVTSGGVINATSSGISSGTATASFVGGVLVVNAAPNTPANIRGASILIGNNVANSKYITISPPNALANNYQVFFPAALPGSTQILTLDSSGNIGANTAVDNVTLQFVAGVLSVKNGGITGAQLGPAGNLVSTGGNTTITTGSYADLNGSSLTVTVGTRPLFLYVTGRSIVPSNASTFTLTRSTGATGVVVNANIQLQRGVGPSPGSFTAVATTSLSAQVYNNSDIAVFSSNVFAVVDAPAAGVYTYKLQALVSSSGTTTPELDASSVALACYPLGTA